MNNIKRERKRKYSRFNKKRYGNKPEKGRIDISDYINKVSNTTPEKAYQVENNFQDFNLSPALLDLIARAGYEMPTEIQDKTISHIREGKDVIGIAGTGTGKTAAFLIPIIDMLIEKPQNYHTLIITPTRELATQIYDEYRNLTRGLGLYASTLIGGINVYRSIQSLERTNHLIIGTPGRLIDMAKRGRLRLDKFKTLVLDEFDRMLDMGFLEDVQYLSEKMTSKAQTLLFSATMDKTQKGIVQGMTRQPVEVKAGKGTQFTSAIEQDILRIPKGGCKIKALHGLLTSDTEQKVILFCETKRLVQNVCDKLGVDGIKADTIHGDKSQRERERALRKFKKGTINVLVATDVVARGIDVTDVSMVINYEVPRNYNDYIHRIGRTGRAGKKGKAITLIAS